MTTTANTTGSPPPAHNHAAQKKPASAQNAQGGQASGQTARNAAPQDLFASLLALVADASALDTPLLNGAATSQAADDAGASATTGAPTDNPLTALMAWPTPGPHGASATAASHNPAGAGANPAGTHNATPPSATAGPANPATLAATGPDRRSETAHPDTLAEAAAQGPRKAGTAGQAQRAIASPGAGQVNGVHGGETALRWQRQQGTDSFTPPGQALQSVRSTVALDDRFQARAAAAPAAAHWAAHTAFRAGAPSANAEAGPAPALEGLPGASATGGARAAPDAPASSAGTNAHADGGGSDSLGGDGGHGTDAATDDSANPFADAALQAENEALEVQHWGTGALRQASLRVGADGDQSIDIQLSLRGDEVQVDLRSNDEATRELLREQASTALGERLQQGGLQLGGVSVGAQGQGQGNDARSTPSPRQPLNSEDGNTLPTAHRAHTSGHKGTVDLFV